MIVSRHDLIVLLIEIIAKIPSVEMVFSVATVVSFGHLQSSSTCLKFATQLSKSLSFIELNPVISIRSKIADPGGVNPN